MSGWAGSEALNVTHHASSEGGQSARGMVVTEPSSEARLIEVSARQRQDNGNDLFLRGFNAEAIQTEEEIHGLEGDAFVPINKGMVVGKTEAVGSSESW